MSPDDFKHRPFADAFKGASSTYRREPDKLCGKGIPCIKPRGHDGGCLTAAEDTMLAQFHDMHEAARAQPAPPPPGPQLTPEERVVLRAAAKVMIEMALTPAFTSYQADTRALLESAYEKLGKEG